MTSKAAVLIALAIAGALASGTVGVLARESRAAQPLNFGPFRDRAADAERRMLVHFGSADRVTAAPSTELAQAAAPAEKVVREIEDRGFSKVSGLMRRGENYVFQAVDAYGDRVRVVMNARTGEIVGLSKIVQKKK